MILTEVTPIMTQLRQKSFIPLATEIHSIGRLLLLPTNVRLARKIIAVTNTSAYFCPTVSDKEKRFYTVEFRMDSVADR
jgi:hypothetical protein